MVEQLVQIVGALLVLIGFTLAQFGRLDQHSAAYLIVNLLGSAILAVDALLGRQLGFLLLEGVWALVSAWGLIRMVNMRGRPEWSQALRPPGVNRQVSAPVTGPGQ